MKIPYLIFRPFIFALSLLDASGALGQSPNSSLPARSGGATLDARGSAAALTIDIILPATISMNPGESIQYNLRLSNPAPSPDGILITFASSDSSKANTNYTAVFINAGQTAPSRPPSLYGFAQGSATITATAPGLNLATTMVIVGSSMALSPSFLQITGASGAMTLILSPPAASNFSVSLISSNTGVAAVPFSLPITVGTSSINFTVSAVGAGGATITATASGYPAATASALVPNSLSISASSLPKGVVGSNYSATIFAVGGAPPYSWSATGLPTGLSIFPATGIISGVPATPGSSPVTIKVTDANNSTATASLIFQANSDSGASITISSGGSQSANVNSVFAIPLAVIVRDANNSPVSGATITFTVPASGASAALSSNSAVSNAAGIAQVTATANATMGGPYTVSATMGGAAIPVNFLLTNTGLALTMTPANLAILNSLSPPGVLTLKIDSLTSPVVFTLISSNPDVATVPASLQFPTRGATLQDFLVTAVGSGTTVITAGAPGYQTVTANVTVNPDLTEGRFLEQASFGPTAAEIAKVRSLGIKGWLDSQFAMPETAIPILPQIGWATTPSQTLIRLATAPDQLRQRMAWTLGEIIVISMNKNLYSDTFVPYLRILSGNAFGNYRTLLSEIAKSPQMGKYLDMANSNKPLEADRRTDGMVGLLGGANENFARELMQLFTIGLNALNLDGSTKLVNGQPVPTYTQTDVRQIALALTGWTYPTAAGAIPAANNVENFLPPVMETRPANHDTTQKTFLGCTLPANQSVEQDLDGVLDCVFNHPNTGPFLATRFIRSLVTSNPSTAFIQRIATVFNNNGSGVRGDLQTVLRAILTDPEARQDRATVNSGKLKDQIYTIVSFTRLMNGSISLTTPISWDLWVMNMPPNNPLSVFNFFSPLYRLPLNPTLAGPEFQIYTPSESAVLANTLYRMIIQLDNDPGIDPSPFLAVARNTLQLLDLVDQKFFYGRMPAAMRVSMSRAIDASYDNTQRVQTALFLAALSGHYQTQF